MRTWVYKSAAETALSNRDIQDIQDKIKRFWAWGSILNILTIPVNRGYGFDKKGAGQKPGPKVP
jgi:hypothetical protein